MTISFILKSSISDVDYFKQILSDADKLTVSVRWRFDEQQADPFHHHFNSDEFRRRLQRMVDENEQGNPADDKTLGG